MIQKVLKSAALLGACSKTEAATTWRSLGWLFFSPQGREFCEEHNFPGIELWGEMKQQHDLKEQGIYCDEGAVELEQLANVALVGKTTAKLTYSNPQKAHRVILMHGAEATIKATNYAVVLVVKIGSDCTVTIDKDDTATILW